MLANPGLGDYNGEKRDHHFRKDAAMQKDDKLQALIRAFVPGAALLMCAEGLLDSRAKILYAICAVPAFRAASHSFGAAGSLVRYQKGAFGDLRVFVRTVQLCRVSKSQGIMKTGLYAPLDGKVPSGWRFRDNCSQLCLHPVITACWTAGPAGFLTPVSPAFARHCSFPF